MTRLATFRDGTTIPIVGFGTYPLRGDDGERAIAEAIEGGYRLIDTATQYENEDTVGRAIRASGVARDELTITTKLAGRDHGSEKVGTALERSLDALGIDTLDLWLIHWPNPSVDLYVETFQAMLALRDEGLVRHVGVSNFKAAHLMRLHAETGEFPIANQIQLSPLSQRRDLRQMMASNGIQPIAWGPLGHRESLPEMQTVRDVAVDAGITASQALLAWHAHHGIVSIPKSSDPKRQQENLAAADITLSDEQIRLLDDLDAGDEHVWDADEHEEF